MEPLHLRRAKATISYRATASTPHRTGRRTLAIGVARLRSSAGNLSGSWGPCLRRVTEAARRARTRRPWLLAESLRTGRRKQRKKTSDREALRWSVKGNDECRLSSSDAMHTRNRAAASKAPAHARECSSCRGVSSSAPRTREDQAAARQCTKKQWNAQVLRVLRRVLLPPDVRHDHKRAVNVALLEPLFFFFASSPLKKEHMARYTSDCCEPGGTIMSITGMKQAPTTRQPPTRRKRAPSVNRLGFHHQPKPCNAASPPAPLPPKTSP